MKNILSIAFLIIVTLSVSAETYKAKALLLNGNIVEGKAILPMNMKIQLGNINFTTNAGKKIKSEEIKKITYYYDDNKEATFERLSSLEVNNNFHQKKEKCEDKRKYWMLVLYSSENITAYNVADNYSVSTKGNLISEYANGFLNLLIKTPDEECAAIIDRIYSVPTYIGKNSVPRKKLAKYFERNAELVKRIKNKEFDDLEFPELAMKLSERL